MPAGRRGLRMPPSRFSRKARCCLRAARARSAPAPRRARAPRRTLAGAANPESRRRRARSTIRAAPTAFSGSSAALRIEQRQVRVGFFLRRDCGIRRQRLQDRASSAASRACARRRLRPGMQRIGHERARRCRARRRRRAPSACGPQASRARHTRMRPARNRATRPRNACPS